jgi:hypothetical protein
MSYSELEQILPGWHAASQSVAQGLEEWRKAYPKATLSEIEDVVFEATQNCKRRLWAKWSRRARRRISPFSRQLNARAA